jgi:uncharacterized protein (TIGR02246 family)
MTSSVIQTDVTDADKSAVASVPGRIVAAWAAQDPAAFAAVFTEDGSMILPGVYCKGRDGIRSFMAGAFDGPYRGTRVTGTPLAMNFLGSSAAVVVTEGGVLAPGETRVADERAVRATWVMVKDQGRWQLAAYHNGPRDGS